MFSPRTAALFAVLIFSLFVWAYVREFAVLSNTLELKGLVIGSMLMMTVIVCSLLWYWRDRFMPLERHFPELVLILVFSVLFAPLFGSLLNRSLGKDETPYRTFAQSFNTTVSRCLFHHQFKRMRTYSVLFASLLAFQLAAQNSVAFFPEELVVTANSLNLRAEPDATSKKVASLPQGTILAFLESWNNGQYTQADTTDENSPYGRWLKVRSKNSTGWVFDLYVSGTTELYYENSPQFDTRSISPLYWYGVYARDSFSDELRKVQVRLAEEQNEFYGGAIKTLKTNQNDPSKFLIASHAPLPTGYCGPLGVFDPNQMFFSKSLGPGSQLSIYPGNDLNDTIMKPTYGLAATGCASFENNFVRITNYNLTLLDYTTEPITTQSLTDWVLPEIPEVNPSVDLLWFGDLDRDNKPDAIIQDCPYEVGCRASLFLSSKAKPGEYLRKSCEFYWPGD